MCVQVETGSPVPGWERRTRARISRPLECASTWWSASGPWASAPVAGPWPGQGTEMGNSFRALFSCPVSRCCPGCILPRIDSVLENIASPGTGFVFSTGDSVLCSENQGPRAGLDGGWGWVAPAHVTGSCSLADRPVTRWGTPAAYLRVSPARLSAARNGASAPLQ